MKTTTFLAMLAFWVNGFAQIIPTAASGQIETLTGLVKIRNSTADLLQEKPFGSFQKKPAPASRTHIPAENQTVQIIDSIYHWHWNSSYNGWNLFSKDINMVYNANYDLIGYEKKSWDGTVWLNFSRYINTYDANHNKTNELVKYWNGSTWNDSYQTIKTYDDRNNQTNRLNQFWDGNAWVNTYQSVWAYKMDQHSATFIDQSWNGTSWDITQQDSSAYDANQNLTSIVSMNIWNEDGILENFSKLTYGYDLNNRQISVLFQEWKGDKWVYVSKDTTTYDEQNHQSIRLTQKWDGNAWVPSSKDSMVIDANGLMTSRISQSLDVNNSNFESSWTSGLDSSNFEKSYSYKVWQNHGNIMLSDSTYTYYHNVVTGIANLEKPNFAVFPNPTNGQFTISSIEKINSVEICNLLGARISAQINLNRQSATEIDLSGQPKGIYMVKIMTGTKSSSRKIVLQ